MGNSESYVDRSGKFKTSDLSLEKAFEPNIKFYIAKIKFSIDIETLFSGYSIEDTFEMSKGLVHIMNGIENDISDMARHWGGKNMSKSLTNNVRALEFIFQTYTESIGFLRALIGSLNESTVVDFDASLREWHKGNITVMEL